MNTSQYSIRKECPICKNNNYTILFKKPTNSNVLKKYFKWRLPKLKSEEFIFECTIVECKNCSLIYHVNYLNQNQKDKIYGTEDSNLTKYKKLKRKKNTKKIKNIYNRNLNIAFHLLNKNKNIKVLDFGSGWGEWAVFSNEYGFETFGCEIDDFKIKYSNKNNLKLLDIDNIKEKSINFINTEQVFEHLEDPIKYIKLFEKIVTNNGVVRISVPNGIKIKKNIKYNYNWLVKNKSSNNSLNPIWLFEHINCYTPKSIIYMMENNGFRQIKLSFFKYLFINFNNTSIIKLFYDGLNHSLLYRKTNLYFRKNNLN